MKRYKDMSILELKALIKKTSSDRAALRIRVTGANVSAYDAQIEECEKELARRNAKTTDEG